MTPDDPRDHLPDDQRAGAPASTDELASALVDGVLSPDEATAARRRPDVVARAAEMEGARAAVRSVSSPDLAARDRAVAAALAAFDDVTRSPGAPAAAPSPVSSTGAGHEHPVADLGVHRRARHGSLPRWLAAAAAVVLVVAGATSLAVLGPGGSDDDASDSAASVSEAESSTAEPRDEDGAATAGDAEAPVPGAEEGAPLDRQHDVGDLGTFASEDALVGEVTSVLESADDAAQQAPATDRVTPSAEAFGALAATCPTGVPTPLDDPDSVVRLRARAVVDGRDLDVWVIGTAGSDRVVALDTTCTVVVDRSLA